MINNEFKSDLKKKTGRKPKIVNEVNSEALNGGIGNTNDVPNLDNTVASTINQEQISNNAPKKRGRKPKQDISDVESETKLGLEPNNMPKKRGRKPKSKNVVNVNTTEKDGENIIIHLPIKSEYIKNNLNETELLTYTPDVNYPVGYEENIAGQAVDNYQFLSQKNNPNIHNELTGAGPKPNSSFCSFPFDEKQKDIFEVIEGIDTDNSIYIDIGDETEFINNRTMLIENEHNVIHDNNWYKSHELNCNSNIEETTKIDKVMDFIKKQRESDFENLCVRPNKSAVEKCLIQFDEANRTNNWPSSTSIYCWWCCHPFSGTPCSLPSEFKLGTFIVSGIFCSPECAAAYNFDDTNSGFDLWERYSLLNFLYRKVYNDRNIKIKSAPPRQTLKIFGGNLTIKEFRSQNINYETNFKIIMPPMVSIIPLQEIMPIDKGYSSKNEKKYVYLEKDKISISNCDTSLRLKRNKPIPHNNALEKCLHQVDNQKDDESISDYV
jgi:hypothetical protein